MMGFTGRVTTKTRSGQNSTLLLRGSARTSHGVDTIERSLPTSRGWTYQERPLPPRTLHCAKDRLYWECRHGYRSEDDIDQWEKDVRTKSSFVKNLVFFDTLSKNWNTLVLANPIATADKEHAARSALLFWYYEVVASNYSQRTLTYGSDRLPAVSGIAKCLSAIWEGEYLCGLWNLWLAEALLLIRRTGNHEPLLPPLKSPYRAPSWSWAAYDFPVQWINGVAQDNVKIAISIMGASVTTIVGGDEYGEVRDGSIQVFGRTDMVTLEEYHRKQFPLGKWLMNDKDQPIGWCNMDFDYPGLWFVHILLCVVRTAPVGYVGGVLCLKRSERNDEMFERVGCGRIGTNAPGTFQTPGIGEASRTFLRDMLVNQPQVVTLV